MLCFNAPLMMTTVYTCIILISWLGAKMIISSTLTTGELMSLLAYCMNILMQSDDAVHGICHDLYEYSQYAANFRSTE